MPGTAGAGKGIESLGGPGAPTHIFIPQDTDVCCPASGAEVLWLCVLVQGTRDGKPRNTVQYRELFPVQDRETYRTQYKSEELEQVKDGGSVWRSHGREKALCG